MLGKSVSTASSHLGIWRFSFALSHPGRNLKEWLQEQFNKKPEEQSEDALLHNAAYVGDLDTLRNLLQEDSFRE